MATISENLQIIADSTAAIKQAIIDKGGDASGDITTWADAISGLSGGGSGDSTNEIAFIGTQSTQATSVNLVGTLYAPENILRGYLVMMDYAMMLRTSFQYISNSVTSVNMSLNYDEPLFGGEGPTPVLILMYNLSGDTYGKWRVQIVTLTQQSGSSNN